MADQPRSLACRAFTNALCLLREGFDKPELMHAGVVENDADWALLREDASLFFVSIGARRRAALWAMIEDRQPEELRARGRERARA